MDAVAAGRPVAVHPAALVVVRVVGGALLDAVLACDLLIAQAHVRANLTAFEAVGARAKIEVGLVGLSVGDAATARTVDRMRGVARALPADAFALAADGSNDGRVGARYAA